MAIKVLATRGSKRARGARLDSVRIRFKAQRLEPTPKGAPRGPTITRATGQGGASPTTSSHAIFGTEAEITVDCLDGPTMVMFSLGVGSPPLFSFSEPFTVLKNLLRGAIAVEPPQANFAGEGPAENERDEVTALAIFEVGDGPRLGVHFDGNSTEVKKSRVVRTVLTGKRPCIWAITRQ